MCSPPPGRVLTYKTYVQKHDRKVITLRNLLHIVYCCSVTFKKITKKVDADCLLIIYIPLARRGTGYSRFIGKYVTAIRKRFGPYLYVYY